MKITTRVTPKLIYMSMLAVIALVVLTAGALGVLYMVNFRTANTTAETTSSTTSAEASQAMLRPLEGKTIYRDDTRPVTLAEKQLRSAGRTADADALKVVSSQPGTTWLVGPNASDPTAQKDIREVIRTSSEAAAQNSTPVYQLYALPHRDACAEYSKGGFETPNEYKEWLNQIIASVKTPSVFLIETDSIGNIAAKNCLSQNEVTEREQLLNSTVQVLRQSPNTVALYLDAAHSEWFSDTSALVGSLKRAGFDAADGVFVNTSFFIETKEISEWSKKLLEELGGEKGVIIDTSRNGNGTPASNLTGEARWCNPKGRSIGLAPRTQTSAKHIHAYLWIKNIGESDGNCAGNAAAGTFVPELALDLVRNRT